jgi:hypothetical protein
MRRDLIEIVCMGDRMQKPAKTCKIVQTLQNECSINNPLLPVTFHSGLWIRGQRKSFVVVASVE